ncbi:hypothetical protein PAEH1_01600 [Paenalcaligenes hominis]|uniref:DUF2158 domain-containing protein n=2 Tax=Paenalcaligenes hominis TaxID=643674 RepID=A0A1U9JXP2_9BURK|nr:hypothetical protein PAEH1_01600 [Paenalcaligenes hominis]
MLIKSKKDYIGKKEMFQIGDVVKLNSGGPAMTITQLGLTHGRVECAWFDLEGTIHTAFIHAKALQKV